MQQEAALHGQGIADVAPLMAAPQLLRVNSPIETVPYLQSVIPTNRLDYLVETCRRALQHRPGHVLEIGVYRGGSLSRLAEVVAEVCPEYRAIGIDTFSGHPYSDGHPVHPEGKYQDVDLRELATHFSRRPYGHLVELHCGRVENILRPLALKNVAFAHVDCDLYLPVGYCAKHLPAIMSAGATIYFDDYGHEHCPGATLAVEESFAPEDLYEVTMLDDGTCWSCYLRLGD